MFGKLILEMYLLTATCVNRSAAAWPPVFAGRDHNQRDSLRDNVPDGWVWHQRGRQRILDSPV